MGIRIDAILVTTLSAKKRQEFGQYGKEKDAGKRSSLQTLDSHKSVHLGCETSLKFPWKWEGKPCTITGRMDYALWYGRRNEAEANLVVVEAKKTDGGAIAEGQVLCYMGKSLSRLSVKAINRTYADFCKQFYTTPASKPAGPTQPFTAS